MSRLTSCPQTWDLQFYEQCNLSSFFFLFLEPWLNVDLCKEITSHVLITVSPCFYLLNNFHLILSDTLIWGVSFPFVVSFMPFSFWIFPLVCVMLDRKFPVAKTSTHKHQQLLRNCCNAPFYSRSIMMPDHCVNISGKELQGLQDSIKCLFCTVQVLQDM